MAHGDARGKYPLAVGFPARGLGLRTARATLQQGEVKGPDDDSEDRDEGQFALGEERDHGPGLGDEALHDENIAPRTVVADHDTRLLRVQVKRRQFPAHMGDAHQAPVVDGYGASVDAVHRRRQDAGTRRR